VNDNGTVAKVVVTIIIAMLLGTGTLVLALYRDVAVIQAQLHELTRRIVAIEFAVEGIRGRDR